MKNQEKGRLNKERRKIEKEMLVNELASVRANRKPKGFIKANVIIKAYIDRTNM